MRKVYQTQVVQWPGFTRSARVFRDAEWDEYRVRFYTNGKLMPDQDYHTGDKLDAIATANITVYRNEQT